MNEDEQFLSTIKTKKILGISDSALRKLANDGDIQFYRRNVPGSHRFYNVTEYLNRFKTNKTSSSIEQNNKKRRICYCRVSTRNQKDDLQRQIEYLRSLYPKSEIITDIGSGLNFERKGIKTILELAIAGNIEELVVAHKDRLCRFGFELFSFIISRYSNGKIVVLDKQTDTSPETELTNDILQILTIFSARLNGRRKYKTGKKKEENKGEIQEDVEV